MSWRKELMYFHPSIQVYTPSPTAQGSWPLKFVGCGASMLLITQLTFTLGLGLQRVLTIGEGAPDTATGAKEKDKLKKETKGKEDGRDAMAMADGEGVTSGRAAANGGLAQRTRKRAGAP